MTKSDLLTKAGPGFRLIPLTRGKFVIVSPEDFFELSQHNWFAHRQFKSHSEKWYACRSKIINGKNTLIYMHRQIFGVNGSKVWIDHINGDGLDNRRENLRICTPVQNCANQKKTRGTSRFKGVCEHGVNQWRARIAREELGYFDSEEEAAKAYDRAAFEKWGEFARLNFPNEGGRVQSLISVGDLKSG